MTLKEPDLIRRSRKDQSVYLKKDKGGKVIGIEVLYFTKEDTPIEFKALSKAIIS